MKSTELSAWLTKRLFILDGATGTELQLRGLPGDACPEAWVLANPHVLQEVQRAYFGAGADAVLSCTFGANRIKLAAHGVETDVAEMNARLVRLSREIAPAGKLVAGDLSSTGQLVAPFGPLAFEDAVALFREQVRGLMAGGADFIFIETIMDIQEARAAVIGAREAGDLPIVVSLTFEESGRTLTGTPPDAAAITLRALGADVVGCNCSVGPAEMLPVIEQMAEIVRAPLLAKPNAGLPTHEKGRTIFKMDPERFAELMEPLARAGAGMLGGCCGTTPEHIRVLRTRLEHLAPPPREQREHLWLSSAQRAVSPRPEGPLTIVGERINPTGKPQMQKALKDGRYDSIARLAREQAAAGALLLDVNVGVPGLDEAMVLMEVVDLLSVSSPLPLCLDSSSPDALAAALRIYPGRALINSISAERGKLEQLLPVAARYGAAVIILPVGDEGVPTKMRTRRPLIERVFARAQALGYARCDVVVDGLVMAVSSDAHAARETLQTLEWAAGEFGVNTIVGLSNVSFGLPERAWLNATFLAMAEAVGLTMAIAHPGEERIAWVKAAADALTGRDPHCLRYIGQAPGMRPPSAVAEVPPNAGRRAYQAVLEGEREGVVAAVDAALKAGLAPLEVMDRHLLPALEEVGARFERREYFLPQLMLAAEAMERAFAHLEPHLKTTGGRRAGTVLLATVRGDVHDIGKNIVALMLRNHGYETIDLGKDVACEEIVAAAREREADLIMLSALMTTTMPGMPEVIAAVRAARLAAKVVVGGAVVTDSYAREIGADGYAPDAVGAVKLAGALIQST